MSSMQSDTAPETKRIRLDGQGESQEPEVTLSALDMPSPPVENGPAEQSTGESAEVTAVTEADVGILQYTSPDLPGFTGIIKDRISDFLVNEVDKSGHVVHLLSTETPKPTAKESDEAVSDIPALSKEEVHKLLADVVGAETADKIQAMLENPEDKKTTVTCPPQDDKLQRTKIHQLFKEHFKDKLVSTTQDGSIVVRWWRPSDKNDKRAMKDEFAALGGPYLQFSLYKENKDTMEAINTICKICRLAPKSLGYAGTKDKRAITVQSVTAYHARADKFTKTQEMLNRQGIYVGDFKYVKDPLKLGDLSGNRFGIVLRRVAGASQEAIEETLESLKNNGFINYYGMQRFGTGTISTHAVGKCILKGNWREAIDLILKPRASDRYDWAKARKVWEETRDPEQALKIFPRKANLEIAVLKKLKSNPADYAGAFSAIPRNMRLMYVHAYQSYIWNHAASERIRLYGAKEAVVGDIVSLEAGIEDKENEEENDRINVKIVTEEDLDKYTIFDVVLPQPGTEVMYPSNETYAVYEKIMGEDGLSPRDMNHGNKSFIRYDNPTIKLCRTDADGLKGEPELESQEGQYLALRLHLSLAASQYATMALREVMKQQTSAAYHSGLKRARVDDEQQQA
ncbi:multisubstrate pseudouridine synthase 7 [Umbelopsis nana]